MSRPAESRSFSPRTRPVVPPIHHSVTYHLDDKAYADVQAGGLDEHCTAASATRRPTSPRLRWRGRRTARRGA